MGNGIFDQPRKRTAAGALFTDGAGRVLLVNPTYKPQWEVTGGIVEKNEAPSQAAQREVFEEIGLRIQPSRLLSLDYRPASPGRNDLLRFIFWGGELSEEETAAIRLPSEELSEWGFFTLEEARERLTPSLSKVVAGCLEILAEDGGGFQYIEHAE